MDEAYFVNVKEMVVEDKAVDARVNPFGMPARLSDFNGRAGDMTCIL